MQRARLPLRQLLPRAPAASGAAAWRPWQRGQPAAPAVVPPPLPTARWQQQWQQPPQQQAPLVTAQLLHCWWRAAEGALQEYGLHRKDGQERTELGGAAGWCSKGSKVVQQHCNLHSSGSPRVGLMRPAWRRTATARWLACRSATCSSISPSDVAACTSAPAAMRQRTSGPWLCFAARCRAV